MKSVVAIILFLIVVACSSNKDLVANRALSISNEDKVKGKELYEQNDCLTCHGIDNQDRVGPSFMQVASRYDATAKSLQMLTKKIREGGNGTWGKIYMTPHSSMTETEANQIVKFILSLKK